jgi:hypothetical protein
MISSARHSSCSHIGRVAAGDAVVAQEGGVGFEGVLLSLFARWAAHLAQEIGRSGDALPGQRVDDERSARAAGYTDLQA